MPVKLSGADFRRFWADDSVWNPKSDVRNIVEDETITILTKNGTFTHLESSDDYQAATLQDVADLVMVSGGFVYNELNPNGYEDAQSFESVIRRWLKRQTRRIVSVEIQTERLNDLKLAVKQLGGKIVS